MLTNTERQQIVEEVNTGTYGIDEALDDIAAAQKGEEVRKALYAEALVLNREGHAGSTDMIARQQVANLQTSVNGQISTLRTEVGEDIDDLETALNSGLATQNGRIAAQNATIANVVANYNVEYGSTELWASTGETGALAAGTTVTLSEDVSHFDYIDIYSFCGNSNVLDTVPVDAKLQSSQGYALRWVNLSDPDSGSYKAYVRIIETRLHIIGTTLTIDHQVTYRNGEEVNISGAEITQSNRSTYMGELGIMKIVGRKITANTEIEDVRIGADGTTYNSAGQAVRAQVQALNDATIAADDTLKSALDDVVGAVSDSISIDMESATTISGLISSSNEWSITDGFYSYALSVNAGQYRVITVTAGENNAVIGILASSTLVRWRKPTYATGYDDRVVIPSGETRTMAIPSDCVYIVIMKESNIGNHTPASVILSGWKTIPAIDETLTVSGDAADAKATGDKIDTILDAITENETVNFESATTISGIINSSNEWSITSGFYSYALSVNAERFPERYRVITVTAGENNAVIGILASSTLVRWRKPTYATGYDDRVVIPSGETRTMAIPSDCVYIVIMKESNIGNHTPASAVYTIFKTADIDQETIYLRLHEKPENTNILNIIKRCRQMTDIKWTPAVNLKRLMRVTCGGVQIPEMASEEYYLGTFKAGTEYKGVPYGRVSGTTDAYGIRYGTVGHYIGFDTFISSVSNPKSRLSKEIVGSVGNHSSVIYATVCSGLTCYALNVNEVETASIANISGLNLIGKLNNNGVLLPDNMIKIGDILNIPNSHTGIITDVIRDNNGLIQSVEISEATVRGLAIKDSTDGLKAGGLCIRKGWTRSQLFDTTGSGWGNYKLYRYTGTVPYTPSPYVNVGDEFDGFRIEQHPIMPYEGEGFAYKTGYIPDNAVKLVIIQDGYSYVRVFKDDAEITGSPFAVTKDVQNNINDISVTEIGAGNYTAYLCNMSDGDVTNMTYACHWTVV